MLTIAEVAGLIAAAAIIVQYTLPAALVIILVQNAGTRNTAATWSTVNQAISSTVWPLFLRADSEGTRSRPLLMVAINRTMTLGTALLILVSVLAPLGVSEEVIPGPSQSVEFQYARDPSLWGTLTMPRPHFKFGRLCEFPNLNCPGQYQGVYLSRTLGGVQSVLTDDKSTINTTIPANFTAMFSSATNDAGNTVSGLFDIQYRRWKIDVSEGIDRGQLRVTAADYFPIENLILREDILLKEGLIVDMRDNPGIGFRNHTVLIGLAHGGTWTEDLTWIEPVTRCADTNLTIEFRVDDTAESWADRNTYFLVDRGAFRGLDLTALETPPWTDNQALDLFGRAYKAARMYNVLLAAALNISLPPDPSMEIVPKITVQNTLFSSLTPDTISINRIKGVELTWNDSAPGVPVPNGFVDTYPDRTWRLFASNFTAITNICRGYYSVRGSYDRRANSITNPAVECGLILGASRTLEDNNVSASAFNGDKIWHRNLYICATGIRAGIKTVDFRYNGTEGQLSNLEVQRISDKFYLDEEPKPLWAVEHSYSRPMRFESLWGIVNSSYEMTDGFSTIRSEKLWLPTSPFLNLKSFSRIGGDSLAAASVFVRSLAQTYDLFAPTHGENFHYTGELSNPLAQRFRRLSYNETTASQIPSLILNDGLAAILVGTKTSIWTKPVELPAMLAVHDSIRGLPRARVVAYRRVIRYDLRYAIPALLILVVYILVLLWAARILLASPRILRTLRRMCNQISTGRLATSLLCSGGSDPNQSSREWVRGHGSLVLNFGRERDDYVRLEEGLLNPRDDSSQGGTRNEEVGVPRNEEVGVPRNEEVGAPRNEEVGAPRNEEVGALRNEEVGIPRNEEVGIPRNEEVGVPRNEGGRDMVAVSGSAGVEMVASGQLDDIEMRHLDSTRHADAM